MDDGRFYNEILSAYLRGHGVATDTLGLENLQELAEEHGLSIYNFKRTASLPRVRRVLGILRGLMPEGLLDIGSGRGVFLWPLLDEFRDLQVTAVDLKLHHLSDFHAVRQGGIDRLNPVRADVNQLPFTDDAFDVTTALEVLEHLDYPHRAVIELVRVTRRFVVISVPSRPDDNPEHLHLLTAGALDAMFVNAGASRVSFQHVLNHMVGVVSV